jgi:protein-S-isoprenylcysteine O-methyltransferase Ste14
MLPALLLMYWRLSLVEEREAERHFGEEYAAYAATVPRFIPSRLEPVRH